MQKMNTKEKEERKKIKCELSKRKEIRKKFEWHIAKRSASVEHKLSE